MNGSNLKKWAIPIVVGLVLIYLIYRYSGGSGSQARTSYVLQSQGGASTGVSEQREASRVAGFQSLATLAGQTIAAKAQKQSEELQFAGLKESLISGQEIERIKAGLQAELGMLNFNAIIRGIEGQEEAYRIASADRRYDTDAQLVAIQRGNEAQANLFTAQAEAAYRTLMAQINAVSSVGQQYRNQSLERQGTILNALSAIWGQPGVYDYQSAFGGPRGPSTLTQIANLLNSAGGLVGRFFTGGI